MVLHAFFVFVNWFIGLALLRARYGLQIFVQGALFRTCPIAIQWPVWYDISEKTELQSPSFIGYKLKP